MGLIVSEGESTVYEPCQAGTHVAICTGLVDLGMQENTFDPSKPPRNKVAIFWTLPDVLRQDEAPFVLREIYTSTLNKSKQGATSKLRTVLDSWRGKPFTEEELKGFDLRNILGKPCLLNVVHESREKGTFANISNVSAMVKGMPVPLVPESTVIFNFDSDNPEPFDFDSLPEWIQGMIKKSINWPDIELKLNIRRAELVNTDGLPF
jgi:hypothetical protein